MREIKKVLLAEAAALGLANVTIVPGGKHQKLIANCGRQTIWLPIAGSGCWRAGRNHVAELRRKVRAVRDGALH